MSDSNALVNQRPPARPLGPGRVILIIVAALTALVGFGAALGGTVLVWAHATQRDSQGFYTTKSERFSTSTYALTSNVDLGKAPGERGWTITHPVGTVRVVAGSAGSDASALFVGIGPTSDVDRWLTGVAHEHVTGANFGPFHTTSTTTVAGDNAPALPSAQSFWAASASGTGKQTVLWPSAQGKWTIVVMNASAQRAVTSDVVVGAKTGVLLPIGLAIGGFGLLALGVAGLLLFAALRDRTTAVADTPAAPLPPGMYPARLSGHLDPSLSRWLWLVKWLLVIPHVIVLAFLWVAVAVLTVVAGFSILFTGRYPRSIFEFNVGVMRWSWRVSFYATSALATDRYPPFSLRADPNYPADFTVDYPPRLSRGLVLVKWWLLALPHYLIVAVFTGGWGFGGNGAWRIAGSGGLIAILAIIAAVVLAVRGHYPDSIFDFVMGMNRWCYRVLAYAALMTDKYPPFRLDGGGLDPGSLLPPPTRPATPAPTQPLTPSQ